MMMFSIEHVLMMVATILLCTVVPSIMRRNPRRAELISYGLAGTLLVNIFVYQAYRIGAGYWSITTDLPMHLCAWANIVTAAALITRRPALIEIAWCWVMTGSVNALITPQLDNSFPEIPFIYFVVGHTGLITAVCAAVFGLNIRPRPGAWLRVMAASQIYFVCAIAINHLTGSNYGFLDPSDPFRNQTVLTIFPNDGPWFYLAFEFAGAALFALALLPFRYGEKT
ncbi:MAG: TIGR02206 family membrane protein [Candidatus Kapabacteria bacterium]|nr:TIGR02206 family membrane protein [Candidatus Kapabacteria bacterium]